jgi:regulator of nucleoside diphosphate kinase
MANHIMLGRNDVLRLRELLRNRAFWTNSDELTSLEDELERAKIVNADDLPTDIVTLESAVTVLDIDSGRHEYYSIVMPSCADISLGRVSVLAPLGTALLGYQVGDLVHWRMPGGTRRLRIDAVQQTRIAEAA